MFLGQITSELKPSNNQKKQYLSSKKEARDHLYSIVPLE